MLGDLRGLTHRWLHGQVKARKVLLRPGVNGVPQARECRRFSTALSAPAEQSPKHGTVLFGFWLLDPDAGTDSPPVEHVNLCAQDIALAYHCGGSSHRWLAVE